MLQIIIRAACAMLLFESALCIAGPDRLADIACNDLEGVERRPFDPGGKSASVLLFYWHDCPVCNSYAPEVNRIVASYTNFAFYIVQVDPDLTAAAAREHAKEYGLRAPVLLDPKHRLVKLAKATVTPQAVIIDKNGR